MAEQFVRVECYSGYKAEERPVRILFKRDALEIAEVEDRWYSPGETYFRVLAKEAERRGFQSLLDWLTRDDVADPDARALRGWALCGQASRLLRDVTLLVSTTLLQILIIALDAVTLWIVLAAIGTRAPFGICFAAFTLASIIADVAPIPLGLGSFEAGLVSMLTLTGTGLEAAFAGTILLRGLTFWAPMLPGLWLARREIRGAAALKTAKAKAPR